MSIKFYTSQKILYPKTNFWLRPKGHRWSGDESPSRFQGPMQYLGQSPKKRDMHAQSASDKHAPHSPSNHPRPKNLEISSNPKIHCSRGARLQAHDIAAGNTTSIKVSYPQNNVPDTSLCLMWAYLHRFGSRGLQQSDIGLPELKR